MADNIDDVIIVTVTKQSRVVTRVGFGTTLWIGQIDVSLQADRFKLYSSRQELIDAGFPTTHQAVRWVDVHLGNDVDPAQFALGRRIPGDTENNSIEVTAVGAGGVWSVTINGEAVSATIAASDTIEEVATKLTTAVSNGILTGLIATAITVAQRATPADEFLDVNGLIGGETITVMTAPAGGGTATDTQEQAPSAPEVWATAFVAINTSSTAKQWYFLNIEDRDGTTIGTAASTVVVEEKIGIFQNSDPDVLTATEPNDISVLRDLSNRRTMVFWTSSDGKYMDAGMSAVAAAADLDAAGGQITWNLKGFGEVLPDDLSTSDKANIKIAGGSYFVDFGNGGRTQTQSVEGEFMRVQTTLDWTKARVKENLFGPLSNTPTKIDLDSTGIGTMEGTLKGTLDTGVINGHYTGDFNPITTAPNPEDIEENDKNLGILRNLVGTARLAQAIRQVFVQVNAEV